MSILLLVPLILFGQVKPIYDILTPTSGVKRANWDNVNQYYIFQVDSGGDTSLTSVPFNHQNGYDGLMEFYLQIEKYYDSGDDLPDTNYIKNGNFNRLTGKEDSTTIIVTDTSWVDTEMFFLFELNYGNVGGWKTLDTLVWSPYADRTVASKVTTVTTLNTLYISKIDPIPTDTVNFWMGDVPLPWKITMKAADHDTSRDWKVKFGYQEHLPERR